MRAKLDIQKFDSDGVSSDCDLLCINFFPGFRVFLIGVLFSVVSSFIIIIIKFFIIFSTILLQMNLSANKLHNLYKIHFYYFI